MAVEFRKNPEKFYIITIRETIIFMFFMFYYDLKTRTSGRQTSKKCKKEDNDNNKKLNYLSLYRYNLVFMATVVTLSFAPVNVVL